MARRPRSAKPTVRDDTAVGPRQPCPCGSGKRYKACHGAPGGGDAFVVRSFQGLAGECDWVALREFVQAGTAPITLRPDAFDGAAKGVDVQAVSLLPGIAPALKRETGEVWVGVQVAHQSGDTSTDLAQALGLALVAEPGSSVTVPQSIGTGPRLQDVVEPAAPFTVTLHGGFDFWFEGVDDSKGQVAATLEQLNESIEPTARLSSVEAAYWVSTGTKEHLRWVMPHDEDSLLTALARLHESGADGLLQGSRLVGSFRAHGLLVPVWDLPMGTGAEVLEEPAAAFEVRLAEALADSSPLSTAGRSARNGLANRQLTIR
jgi:uncharacterized protein DUF5926/SEC-C motif-containing protein